MCDRVVVRPRSHDFRGDKEKPLSYGFSPMRTALIILATIGLCGVCHSSSAVAATREIAAQNVEAGDIKVGDMLQATKDVSLDSAVIAEGSKISVSAKKSANGRVILDVALADGHVVKGVPLAEIKKSFRRVAP
jgi:hypothetical protein